LVCFENFKKGVEKQLKTEYEAKKGELNKELDAMKSKLYRQQLAEKLKINKLNKMQKNLTEKEKENLKKASKLEKEITKTQNHNKNKLNKTAKETQNIPTEYLIDFEEDSEQCICDIEEQNQTATNMSKVRFNSRDKIYNIVDTEEMNRTANYNNNIKILDSYIESDGESKTVYNKTSNNAFNLREINQKLKSGSINNNTSLQNPKIAVTQNIEPKDYQIIEYTINNVKTNNQANKLNISANVSETKPKKNNSISSPLKSISDETTQIQDSQIFQYNYKEKTGEQVCLSFKVDGNMPSDLLQFGKYLLKHIEQEENYRLLFDKEHKQLRQKIKKIFEKENNNDHCLLDYIFELWDKLEISYMNRYKILSELSRLNSRAIYQALDRETEALTDYYHKAGAVVQAVREREKLKIRLQAKSGKSIFVVNLDMLTSQDRESFDKNTNSLLGKIQQFKDKHKLNVLWKGVYYDWVKYKF
jgi:hypothetical protein